MRTSLDDDGLWSHMRAHNPPAPRHGRRPHVRPTDAARRQS